MFETVLILLANETKTMHYQKVATISRVIKFSIYSRIYMLSFPLNLFHEPKAQNNEKNIFISKPKEEMDN